MAMSNLPSIRWVSWNTELTVGVSLTAIPFFASSPFSCAIQTGQLKPPGNTMSSTVLGGAGCASAHDAMSSAISPDMTLREIPFMLSSIDGFLLRIAGGQIIRLRVRSPDGLQRRLLDSFAAFAKLRDIRPRAPHAERLGRERELPRPVARFLLGQDVLHAHRILVDHLVRSLEIQEAGGRRRVAARSEDDLHALFAQEIVGAHHVVEILDLVVDVLHPGVRRREQRERMVNGAYPKERRVADPVRHAGVQQPRPERFVARSVRGAQPDVAEVRDSGVACGKIAFAAVRRAHDDLDLVAGRILEGEELLDAAQLALVLAAVAHRVAGLLDLRAGLVEVLAVF